MPIDSYKLVRKVLIQTHNTKVAQFFSHPYGRDKIDTPESAARNACIIRSKDAAPIITLKLQLFYDVLNRQEVLSSSPEAWNPKPAKDTPQLVIHYRPALKKDSYYGNTRIVIPHYIGGRYPKLPTYHRGSHYGVLTLKDNSQLHINASSLEEAERVLNELKAHIAPNMIHDTPRFGMRKGEPVKRMKIKPYYADHYPHGKVGNKPRWRDYLQNKQPGATHDSHPPQN